jgi:hypothetical protein
VQGNHLHLIVEAPNNRCLARGMQGLAVRIARALNRLMHRRGRVFADHFHSRVVRTPTEAARVIAYVLGNYARHAAQRGEHVDVRLVDRCSSAFPRPTGPPWSPPRERGSSPSGGDARPARRHSRRPCSRNSSIAEKTRSRNPVRRERDALDPPRAPRAPDRCCH